MNNITSRYPSQQKKPLTPLAEEMASLKGHIVLESLADRNQPLPAGVNLETLLREASKALLAQYDLIYPR